MKSTITAIAALILIGIASRSGGQEIVAKLSADAPNVFYADTKVGKVRIKVTSPVVYLPRGGQSVHLRFCEVMLKQDGEIIKHAAGHFNTKPNPSALTFKGDSDFVRVAESDSGSKLYLFVKPGKASIKISIGDETVSVGIDVRESEFAIDEKADALIKKYGFPSKQERHIVSWPDKELIDDIPYVPEAGAPINIQHLEFDKFKFCVFAVDGTNTIKSIHASCKDEVGDDDLSNWIGTTAELQKMQDRFDNIEKQAATEQANREIEEKEREAKELRDFRIWKSKSGTKVEGKFVRFRAQTVEVELRNGKESSFRITALTDEDAEIVRKLAKEDSDAKKTSK